jgi:hypothetical protein
VLYIAGTGRSGSTLLELVLGSLSGVVAVGELSRIWSEGVTLNHRCGCGEAFHDCPFWRDVGARAFGGWDALGDERLASLQPPAVGRLRQLPGIAAPRLRPRALASTLRHYGETMDTLYDAIREVSGAATIVDSSKSNGHAFLLRDIPGIDARVVHLVRDPRGIAYSWSRRVRRPDVVDGEEYLGPWPVGRATREWMAQNVPLHALGALRIRRMRTRYEDMLREPAETLGRVLRFAGSDDRSDELAERLRGREFEVTPSHAIAGNPLRFAYGRIRMESDDGWRTGLPARTQRLVLLRTLPLSAMYGYTRDG